MALSVLPLAELLLGNLLLVVTLLTVIRMRRVSLASRLLTLSFATLTAWVLFRMLSHGLPAYVDKLFWAQMAYTMSALLGVFWLMFTMAYSGRFTPVVQRYTPLLFIIPVIGSLFAWTNDYHHLTWMNLRLSANGWLQFSWGPAALVVVLYAYALISFATWFSLKHIWRGRWHEWRRNRLILLGAAVPIIAHLAYAANLTNGVDLTYFGLGILVWAWGFSPASHRLVDVMPSPEKLLEHLNEGLIVLDDTNRLVDYNPAAKQMLGLGMVESHTWAELLTRKLSIAPQDQVALLDPLDFHHEASLAGESQRTIEIQGHVMTSSRGFLGRIVLLRDITEQKTAELALRDMNRNFESQVIARTAELQQAVGELHDIAARLTASQETERARIARELHDQAGAHFAALGMSLTMVRNAIDGQSTAAARAHLTTAEDTLQATSKMTRQLMSDLHPPELDEQGLLAALQWYGAQWQTRTGVALRVEGVESEQSLDATIRIALFRIVQEALNNIARHAEAQQVVISLVESKQDNNVHMTICDDGVGFDPSILNRPRTQQSGWGMRTIRERARSIGANCVVTSQSGHGTRVEITVERVVTQPTNDEY